MEKKTITIRATVIREQEKLLTVRLEDGLGNAEVSVHKDQISDA